MKAYGEYFCGNKISDYGLENGYVDYATLAKAFDAVLNNEVISKLASLDIYFEPISGTIDNDDAIEELEEELEKLEEKQSELEDKISDLEDLEENTETVEAELEEVEAEISRVEDHISDLEYENGTEPDVYQWYIVSDNGARILEELNEVLYYCDELDMYIWGVTHFGTSWSYVLTNIPCNTGEF